MSLLILTIELLLVAAVILVLFRLRDRLGLAPLYIFVASNQYLQTVLASTVYVAFPGGWLVSPGSAVLFSSSLFAILLLYIREDVPSTRRLIYGVILANVTLTVLAGITSWQLAQPGSVNLLQISPALFRVDARMFLVGTATLLADSLLIILVYEWLFERLSWMPLGARITGALLAVGYFDAVVFTVGSFAGRADLTGMVTANLVGKTYAALLFGAVLATFLRSTVGKAPEPRELADVFATLTYRQKYEATREAHERQSKVLEQIQSANEDLEQFARVASHDLRSPLATLIMAADLLAMERDDGADDGQEDLVTAMRDQAHRMTAMIEGILAYSTAGHLREERRPVELSSTLPRVIEGLTVPPAVRIDVRPGLPTINAEPTRLGQVFANLLSNAIRHVDPEHGRIVIDSHRTPQHHTVTVSDNGVGIPPARIERIFESFESYPQPGQDRSTGLGLPFVRRVLQLYDATVDVASTEGEGTTFMLRFPRPTTLDDPTQD